MHPRFVHHLQERLREDSECPAKDTRAAYVERLKLNLGYDARLQPKEGEDALLHENMANFSLHDSQADAGQAGPNVKQAKRRKVLANMKEDERKQHQLEINRRAAKKLRDKRKALALELSDNVATLGSKASMNDSKLAFLQSQRNLLWKKVKDHQVACETCAAKFSLP